MDFVLTLHSHLPWVLNHGRWPHGSDWICEAAVDTYLPLLARLHRLQERSIPAPVTLGVTPVLANQLASPDFRSELEAFFEQRLEACREAPASLASTGDEHLLPLVTYWTDHLTTLRQLWDGVDGDLVGAFRRLEEAGRLEIISSAATHGFLPLLAREESIRLQLAVGRMEHRRLFGRDPRGCWLPECAYRPSGWWNPAPGLLKGAHRPGIESYLEAEGFHYFFTDAHLVEAGSPLGAYGDIPLGSERFHHERNDPSTAPAHWAVSRSPYIPYRVSDGSSPGHVAALVRDPRSSLQVWSREQGYPGDPSYLEFHKIRWPGGLKYWRVTGANIDLGGKQPYRPEAAAEAARAHARHFAHVLASVNRDAAGLGVITAPFDTELFGHWWFEGVDFLGELYEALPAVPEIRPSTAGLYLQSHPPKAAIRLAEGSWGRDGDFSMWLNPGTAWTWERLWALEDRFWDLAPGALEQPDLREILAQAARQLLLAQSSDWQFMISTGAVPDYATERLNRHVEDAWSLLPALLPDASTDQVEAAGRAASELGKRDHAFPSVLEGVARALGRDDRG
jgi:1,4-alpha-glucan branching enzyme